MADSGPNSGEVQTFEPPRRSPGLLILAALALVLAVAFFLRPPAAPPKVLGTVRLTNDGRQKYSESNDVPLALLTDGSRLYFVEGDNPSALSLWQMPVKGGAPAPVTAPSPFAGLEDISPRRPELMIGGPPVSDAGSGLWRLAVPGGPAVRVGGLTAADAGWSPDGGEIVYATGGGLFLAHADGTGARRLASPPGTISMPRWSPDGKMIRFTVFDPLVETSDLWEVEASGNNLRRLLADSPHLDSSHNDCCGVWTPGGGYYIFQSARGGETSLWAMRETAPFWKKVDRRPVRLTFGPLAAVHPAAARSGDKVYFIGILPHDEVLRIDPETGKVSSFLSGLSAEGVTFSGDRASLAYITYPEGLLWVSKIDGSDPRQLTFAPLTAALPRWSPDGKRIAFSARTPGNSWQIYIVQAGGGSPEHLPPEDRQAVDPSWSADGHSLVFGEVAEEARGAPGNAIRILDLDSHKIRELPGSEGLFSPRWSPDGRYILALAADFQKLSLFDTAAQKWDNLTSISASYPNWSPDSQYIYFSTPFRSKVPFYRLRVSDRKLETLAQLTDFGPLATGRFGGWSGLAPDGSILAARNVSRQEIYELDWDPR
jgi:Tol biopolymer transport system component